MGSTRRPLLPDTDTDVVVIALGLAGLMLAGLILLPPPMPRAWLESLPERLGMFVAPVRDPPPAPVFPSFPDVVQQGLAASDIQIVPLCPKDDTPPPAAPDAPLAVVSDAPPARPVIPERRFAGRPALIALPPAGKTAIRKRRIPHEDVTSLVGRHARAALTTYVAHQHDGRPPFDKVQVSFRVDRRCVVRLLGLRISGALHDKVTADIETTIRRGLRVSVPRTQCEGMTRSVRGSFSLVGVPTDAER